MHTHEIDTKSIVQNITGVVDSDLNLGCIFGWHYYDLNDNAKYRSVSRMYNVPSCLDAYLLTIGRRAHIFIKKIR